MTRAIRYYKPQRLHRLAMQGFLDSLGPGAWAVDNSAHRYNGHVRFEWHARDSQGVLHGGYERQMVEAEVMARKFAQQ